MENMKILLINGSPRRHGHIAQMMDAIEREAQALGATTTLIRVHEMSIRPCMGCMRCRSELKCVLPEDDAQKTLALITDADALVVGAPCYWGNLPGELKMLFDRIVYGMMGESSRGIPKPLHKGKRAVVVTTSTTPFPFNILFHQTRGVVRALKEILGYSGFKIVKFIEKGGTKNHPGLTLREIAKCQKAARKLIR